MSLMGVRVRHPTGIVRIDVDETMYVDAVLNLVSAKTNLRTETGKPAFRLRYGSAYLKRGATLMENGVKDDDLIVMVMHSNPTPVMQAIKRMERGYTKTSRAHNDVIIALKQSAVDINEHTTAVVKDAVDNGMKRTFCELLCPGVDPDAPPQVQLDAMREPGGRSTTQR